MASDKELYNKAALLYDKNQYLAAREAYRDAAQHSEPSRDEVYKLSHAEKSAWLDVLWQLREAYPSSLAIQTALAKCATRVGRDNIAINVYSRILRDFELSELERFHIHIGRLEANSVYTRKIYKPELFILDALYIWELGNKFNAVFRLANILSRIHGISSVETLEQLKEKFNSDELISQLIDRKIDELHILSQIR